MARTKGLTAIGVKNVKAPGRHADGNNLYLNVTKAGAKSWVFMYSRNGRQREMGLGPARDVTLAEARDAATKYRRMLREGVDPLDARNLDVGKPSFGEFAKQHIEIMEAGWKNPKHRAQWRSTLENHAASLADVRIDKVGTPDVLAVLTPIWTEVPETASRLRGRIEAVLDAVKAQGLRSGDNPAAWAGHLKLILPARSELPAGHFEAMPIDDLPTFMADLENVKGMSARALFFTILTAARSGETLQATWPEINLVKKTWTRPASHMKAKTEHRIPLTGPAIAILRSLQSDKVGQLIFPGVGLNEPLSPDSMRMLLRRRNVTADPHGFRSTFRDWVSERTSFPGDVAQMALAHTIGDKTEAAYRRGDLFEKRCLMMEAWAEFCMSKIV